MKVVYKGVLFIGFFLLGHAAYSAGQYRSFLRLAEEEYTTLPNDIFLECLLACGLCMMAVLLMMGAFKDIQRTTELNVCTYDSLDNRTNYALFNHRGKFMHGFQERVRL